MKVFARYFTGTGNTERCLTIIADKLRLEGNSVDMKEFRFSSGDDIRDGKPDLVVFAFSMLGFSPAQIFLRWIKRLPKGAGVSVVVVAVCGSLVVKGSVVNGYSGNATDVIARALAKKGYNAVGTYEVSYPDNWTQTTNPPDEADRDTLYKSGDALALSVANAIVSGSFSKLDHPASVTMPLSVVGILFRSVARRFLGLLYIADENCTGCGLCSASCPASTIGMWGKRNANGRGARPHWGLECQGCNRCINICPVRSIQVSPVRLFLIVVVNIAALLVAISYAGFPASLLGLSYWLYGLLSVACGLVFYIVLTTIQLFPGTELLDLLGRTRFGSRLFLLGSWTRKFRRYTATGFKVPVYWKEN